MIRRTHTGWRVEGPFPELPTDTVDDLGHALILADLLAEGTGPGPRPARPADGLDETTRLRSSVRQLEHALSSRVIVEQAIGVLAERWKVAPRDAFEQLRRVTRSHGLRIHDLAKLVIASSTDATVGLPPELVPQRAEAPPEPRQSADNRAARPASGPASGPTEGGERRERRTRRERPGSDPGPLPAGPGGVVNRVPATAPAPRSPNGRHAGVER